VSRTLVVLMLPLTVRLTIGFLHRFLSSFFFFVGHLHRASASSGTACGSVSAEKPSIAFVFGVKADAGGAGDHGVPRVVARGLTTRALGTMRGESTGTRFGASAWRNSWSALGISKRRVKGEGFGAGRARGRGDSYGTGTSPGRAFFAGAVAGSTTGPAGRDTGAPGRGRATVPGPVTGFAGLAGR
jgi:hypothetical protein